MTRLFNEPAAFADEMIEGFVASHGRWVRRVSGGVARSTRSTPGTVALVIGGGSGHYPAFGGLVGQGLAHGAAMGNLFASPSAQQVYNVAKASDNGGGVLLGYGNYAGDVLHFTQAQEKLRKEGIDCRSIAVTDDISSAPAREMHKRRGIAGDLTVFKVAAAASEAGYTMDDVVQIAERANHRTRSFGVAFTGCTLPGGERPLFTVPEGRMAVGMGIHGEPGIGETDIPTADELAELMVAKLLAEIPEGVQISGARVVPILNGLGSVKYEELFVVYRRVAQLLAEAGLDVVDPQVGELVTSFDMAGTSLTLFWLDEELEQLWLAPADAPAFRRGAVTAQALASDDGGLADVELSIPAASAESRAAAVRVLAALGAAKDVVDANAEELGRIDAIAGDGDHGIGMERGVRAAVEAAADAVVRGAGAATTLHFAGDAWADKAGGTSGALWGMALRAVGDALGNANAPDGGAVATGVADAAAAIMNFGKAKVGDKTLVDVLVPFRDALEAGVQDGRSLTDAWGTAVVAAQQAAEATANLLPLMGRARPHAEKSLGTPDAGAVSMALIVKAIHESLLQENTIENSMKETA
ncbi:dihydroxyacetone kinase family protein [Arthrobacter bambusae]|uniref:Dihydroxyacetone kinase n=1 Tax=Arthrobacter bambusae TaxID=1338426 RepID=A0AAW8DAJ3_9MICC|nr:dihydroxyacetone kinase family protein [Arthrobacter bambusae]MDP9904838.1 dihydroxyacetone kinase [Arthrobacter bambusae]MDQ0129654.1 dihydroxyacetone kinase [Arthrobacter bambusae]MDQ0180733.1 dihydroxyacetone kinase [Arthrobacter bambusae]